jgi:hypothetical protein
MAQPCRIAAKKTPKSRKGTEMRGIISAFAAILMMTGAALAANDEGRIASIDPERMVITLDNGNAYKLPGEFNVEALAEGMEVYLAYDNVGGERQITDMDIME